MRAQCAADANPLGDELVVAGKPTATIDTAFAFAPKHNTLRPARQGGVGVTPAHHSIQFSALLHRQHGSLPVSIYGSNASEFNDSVDYKTGANT
jgi:hypothetical protein